MMRRGWCGVTTALLILAAVPGAALAMSPAELNEAGKSAYTRGEFEAAESLFSQAIAGDPRQALFQYHRGVALARLGRLGEARASYEQALRLNPPPALASTIGEALRLMPPPVRAQPRIPDQPEAPEPIKLTAMPGGWHAEVTLNGTRKTRFLVDTGATSCVISPALAEELYIVVSPATPVVKISTGNGVISGRAVVIPSVRVGDFEATDVRAVVIQTLPPGEEGVLGLSFLARYTVTIDSSRGLLHLRPN
jgi:clan AA aspartic protease (TIGR02281 family)